MRHLTPADAAQRLGITTLQVLEGIRAGRIPADTRDRVPEAYVAQHEYLLAAVGGDQQRAVDQWRTTPSPVPEQFR